MKPSQARSLSKYPLSALSIALFSTLGMAQFAFAAPPTEEEFNALKQEVEQLQQQLKYFTAQQKNAGTTAASAQGKGAIAVGDSSKALNKDAIAIGVDSEAGALAQVGNTIADNDPAIAIGVSAKAINNGTIGIGNKANSTQTDGIALGNRATSAAAKGLAIGVDSKVNGSAESAVAIGDRAEIASSALNAIAVGYQAKSYSQDSVTVGSQANVSSSSAEYAVAIGSQANITDQAAYSVAIGAGSKVTAKSRRTDEADGQGGVALGSGSVANKGLPLNKYRIVDGNWKTLAEGGYDPTTGQTIEYLSDDEQDKSHNATWVATTAGVSVGSDGKESSDIMGSTVITRRIYNLAAGREDTDAVNVAQLKALQSKLDNSQSHYVSINSSEKGDGSNYLNDGATGGGAIAVGAKAKAEGLVSLAVGNNAQVAANQGLAIGANAKAIAETAQDANMMAIGLNAQASKTDAIAMGTNAKAEANNTTAVGAYAQALGNYSFAGGADSYAFGDRAIAIGVHTSEAELGKLVTYNEQNKTNTVNEAAFRDFVSYEKTIKDLVNNESVRNDLLSDLKKLDDLVVDKTALESAVTDQNKREGLVNYQKQISEVRALLVAEGKYARLKALNPYGATGNQAISIGNENLASGYAATSVGTGAKATNYGTSAYGLNSQATANQATALGFASKADGEFSTAVGTAATSSGYTSVAMGYASKANAKQAIAIGHGAQVIAGGGTNNDELGWGSIAIGRSAQSNAGLSVAIGADAQNFDRGQGTYTAAVAIGTGAKTYGTGSVAIGNNSIANKGGTVYGTAVGTTSKAAGDYSVAIGLHGDQTGQNREFGAYGYGSNAIGLYAYARGIYSNALGFESQAIYNDSVSIGRQALANAINSTSLGSKAETHGVNSVAIGYNAQTTLDSSVALGDNSSTNGTIFTVGYDILKSGKQNISDIIGAEKLADYNKKKEELIDLDNKIFDVNENLKDAEYNRIHGATAEIKADGNKKTQENRKVRDELLEKRKEVVKYMKDNFDGSSTWESTAAGVSVGNADLGVTRQINNVAAGTLDTDAVNVAQLKQFSKVPVNVYNNASDTLVNPIQLPISNLNINFVDGLKAEKKKVGEQDVLFVGLDKEKIKNNPDLKGPKGEQGVAGRDGIDGRNGKDGAVGPQGPQGEQGVAGRNGIDGRNGKDGVDGKDGAVGPQGPKGEQGLAGRDGIDGKDGTNGKSVKATTDDNNNIEIVEKPTHTEINLSKKVKNLDQVSSKEFVSGKTVVNNSGITISEGNKQVSVTENGLNNGGNRIINVAAGVNPTDAVNKSQLDQAESRMQHRIDRVNKRADAGTAAAIAQGSVPQVSRPGASGIGIGSGFYGNQSAISLGASRMSDNGHWILKGSLSTNTQGKVGVGAGALYQW